MRDKGDLKRYLLIITDLTKQVRKGWTRWVESEQRRKWKKAKGIAMWASPSSQSETQTSWSAEDKEFLFLAQLFGVSVINVVILTPPPLPPVRLSSSRPFPLPTIPAVRKVASGTSEIRQIFRTTRFELAWLQLRTRPLSVSFLASEYERRE